MVPSGYITRHSPLAHGRLGRGQRLVGVLVPRHRDLPGAADQLSDQRDLEHGLLAHEARRPAVVVQEVGHDQRVEERDVVGRDDDALAVLAQVLRARASPAGSGP